MDVRLVRLPSQKRGRKRVEIVLDAAQAIIVRDGWGAATMHAIAREAGLTAAGVYFYFPDRFLIFDEIIQRHDVQVDKIITERMTDLAAKDWEKLIAVVFDSIEEFCVKNEVARILNYGKDGPFAARWTTSVYTDVLANYLRELCSHYFLLPDIKLHDIKFKISAEIVNAGFAAAMDDDGSIDHEILNEVQAAVITYMGSWMGRPSPVHPTAPFRFVR